MVSTRPFPSATWKRRNIYATDRVELRGKAEVYGDLHANRLAMDDGVVFVGRSNTLNSKTQPSGDFPKMFTRLGAASKANGVPTAVARAQ
jgi:cytoskeletal protein CcmA (bactofilin family)